MKILNHPHRVCDAAQVRAELGQRRVILAMADILEANGAISAALRVAAVVPGWQRQMEKDGSPANV